MKRRCHKNVCFRLKKKVAEGKLSMYLKPIFLSSPCFFNYLMQYPLHEFGHVNKDQFGHRGGWWTLCSSPLKGGSERTWEFKGYYWAQHVWEVHYQQVPESDAVGIRIIQKISGWADIFGNEKFRVWKDNRSMLCNTEHSHRNTDLANQTLRY